VACGDSARDFTRWAQLCDSVGIPVDIAAGQAELPCVRPADEKKPAPCGLPTKSAIDKSATTKSIQDDAKRRETPK
jgi:hypothetical protein